MINRMFKTAAVFLAVGLVASLPAKAALIPVDLEIVLAVDVSGSVSNTEFVLQRDGYVNAFKDPAIQQKIQDGAFGQIAATFVYWSGNNQQVQSVGWTLIDSVATSDAFANAVAAAGRPFSGSTAVGQAINFSANLFNINNYDGTRQLIDISGDGTDNVNGNVFTNTARDAFLAGGTDRAINAIAIESLAVQNWYAANVQGGTGSFTTFASDFSTFGSAVNDKLLREIAPPPTDVMEPASLGLLGLGLAGLGFMTRRRRAAA